MKTVEEKAREALKSLGYSVGERETEVKVKHIDFDDYAVYIDYVYFGRFDAKRGLFVE